MGNEINIATLVISSETYPAIRNSKAQKKVFFEQSFDKNLTYWYKGSSNYQDSDQKFDIKGNELIIATDDSTINMGQKTLLAFEWLLNNRNFDYLVRPTPSSYINFRNLHEFISKNLINEEYVYCGKIQSTNDNDNNKFSFVSGSTFILNKKSVEKILKNKDLWDNSYWDDVALAKLMEKLDIKYQHGDRHDVPGNPFSEFIPIDQYQYRCRADNHYSYPRFLESISLKIVHKFSNELKVSFFEKASLKFLFKVSKTFYIYQFGWKLFLIIKQILKLFLPQKLYLFLKGIFQSSIDRFKHVRFKY